MARNRQDTATGLGANDASRDRALASELLEASGITPTAQRVEIARILLARPQHLSAEQLLALVNEGELAVSKATVYNTLGLFARKGLVREVIVDPSKVFYDSNMTPHHHFYDVESGELEDIDAGRIEIGALPEISDGFRIEGVDVVVRVRREAGHD